MIDFKKYWHVFQDFCFKLTANTISLDEGANIESWDRVKNFYEKIPLKEEDFQIRLDIVNLIKNIQEKGYDKMVYAYTSHYWLRIEKYDPNDNRPWRSRRCLGGMCIDWSDGGMSVRISIRDERERIFASIELCPEFEQLLERLGNVQTYDS